MRVYLPGTFAVLAGVIDRRELGPAPITGFAVTPGLREWYVDDDVESLEYAAMAEAARASLRLLDADPGGPARRVVLAADVPDSAVDVRDDLDRGVVHLSAPVALADIAAVHVDEPAAAPAITAAAQAIVRADLGDPGAQELVDDAEGFELAWYATQEIPTILANGG